MAEQIDGGLIGGQHSKTFSDEEYERYLYGEDDVADKESAAPAPSVQHQTSPSADNLARYKEAQAQQRIADLEERVRRAEQASANRANNVPESSEHDDSQYALTPEEEALLQKDPATSRLLRKLVSREVQAASSRASKKAEARVADIERQLREGLGSQRRTAEELRAQSFEANLAAAVPDGETIYNTPEFASFLQESVSTPSGLVSRADLFRAARNSLNVRYVADQINEFRARSGGQAPSTVPASEASRQVQERAAQTQSTSSSRGGPSLAALQNGGQRKPNMDRVLKEFNALEGVVRSGRADNQQLGRYDTLVKILQRYGQQ